MIIFLRVSGSGIGSLGNGYSDLCLKVSEPREYANIGSGEGDENEEPDCEACR